jgi:uncharacterized membrane protein
MAHAFWQRLRRILRHLWMDDADLARALPPDLLDRIARHVAEGEHRHTGEVRIHAEAGLPLSYLWRDAPARERAITLFGKLRVWDTEHNNGVLIYLLLAEHAIEVVADRGVARHVPPQAWQALVTHLGRAFREGRYEAGLLHAVDDVSALLAQHFPRRHEDTAPNELPDRPTLG